MFSFFNKHRILIILCWVGAGMVCPPAKAQVNGDYFRQAVEKGGGELTVYYYPEEGFAYKNDNGILTGVEIDIFKQFVNFTEKTYGIELEVNYVPEPDFGQLTSRVMNAKGGVFGLGNVTITEERKQNMQFSQPYLTNIAVLITHEQVPTLSGMNAIREQFAGKTAIAFDGTIHEQRIQEIKKRYYPSVNIKTVDSDDEVIKTIASSPDYFGYVDLSVYWLASQNGQPIKRHPAGDESSEKFGFIMPQNSDWNKPMDKFFNIGGGYRSNITYRNILVEHLGVEVTQMLQLAQN